MTAWETRLATARGEFAARITEPARDSTAVSSGVVLALHGFPDDASTFDAVAAALAAEGYRVVAPYLRGYAPSPLGGDLGFASLRDDLLAQARAADGGGPVHLLAHDYGAQLSFAAMAAEPGAFRSAVLMSGAHPRAISRNTVRHPRQLWLSRYIVEFQVRGWAERRVSGKNYAYLDRLWDRWSPPGRVPSAHRGRVKATIAASMPAPIEMYRGGGFGEIGVPIRVPTLFLTGAADGCSLSAMADGREREFAAPYERRILPGVGHFPQLESPAVVSSAAIAWFADHR
ncbi:alpha/beta hydrolase [Microbacterium invictum]|uniref:Alpha/beta hydrolase n=1 Tax=Microbacterium invictum TaxID=515415 RepID=A0ABZ0V9B4_9MICO|nr:alpha/beta hydrolase [Microbacterium invictum]WQB69921.1 alpha/beta hydrolase [Microbacterium invictum]